MSLSIRFRNASIRTKYLLAVSALLLCLFLCGLYVFMELYHASYSSAVGRARDSFEESYEELTRFEDRLNHLATLLQCDSDVIRMLSGTQSFSTMEYLRAKEDLLPKLYSMQDGSGDYFCSLYVDSSLDLLDRSSRIRLLNDVTGEHWAQESLTGWGFRRFYGGRELSADRPALIAPLRRLDKLTERVALLRIDASPIALRRMLALPQGEDYTSCLLLSPSGERIAASGIADPTDYGEVFSEEERTGFISYRLNERSAGGNTLFSRRLQRSGWLLVTAVQGPLLRASILGRYSFLAVGAFCMALAGMALHKIRLDEKARLAAAGAAYHQHIFVSGRSGVFGAVIHGQTFRLGEENILGEYRVDIGRDVFLRSPAGRSVLLVFPILFRVPALDVDDTAKDTGNNDSHAQIEGMKAGRWTGKSNCQCAKQAQHFFRCIRSFGQSPGKAQLRGKKRHKQIGNAGKDDFPGFRLHTETPCSRMGMKKSRNYDRLLPF